MPATQTSYLVKCPKTISGHFCTLLFLLLYHAVPLLQVQCTPDHWLPSLVSLLYFIFGLLLLLSGDVELNPGPVTGIYTYI